MADKYVKRCSTPLAIRETQTKPIMSSPWVAQSVKCPTLAQVMISVCEFKPHTGLSVSSEPTSNPLSLSAPPPNKFFKILKKHHSEKLLHTY